MITTKQLEIVLKDDLTRLDKELKQGEVRLRHKNTQYQYWYLKWRNRLYRQIILDHSYVLKLIDPKFQGTGLKPVTDYDIAFWQFKKEFKLKVARKFKK